MRETRYHNADLKKHLFILIIKMDSESNRLWGSPPFYTYAGIKIYKENNKFVIKKSTKSGMEYLDISNDIEAIEKEYLRIKKIYIKKTKGGKLMKIL